MIKQLKFQDPVVGTVRNKMWARSREYSEGDNNVQNNIKQKGIRTTTRI